MNYDRLDCTAYKNRHIGPVNSAGWGTKCCCWLLLHLLALWVFLVSRSKHGVSCCIWGFHSGGYEYCCLEGDAARLSGASTISTYVLIPSSAAKSKPGNYRRGDGKQSCPLYIRESELLYDWRTANHLVLAPSPSNLSFQLNPCSHSPYETSSLKRKKNFCFLQADLRAFSRKVEGL
jgi:hypothetical protein